MDNKELTARRYLAMYAMLQRGRPRCEVAQRFCCSRAATYRAEKYARSISCFSPEEGEHNIFINNCEYERKRVVWANGCF